MSIGGNPAVPGNIALGDTVDQVIYVDGNTSNDCDSVVLNGVTIWERDYDLSATAVYDPITKEVTYAVTMGQSLTSWSYQGIRQEDNADTGEVFITNGDLSIDSGVLGVAQDGTWTVTFKAFKDGVEKANTQVTVTVATPYINIITTNFAIPQASGALFSGFQYSSDGAKWQISLYRPEAVRHSHPQTRPADGTTPYPSLRREIRFRYPWDYSGYDPNTDLTSQNANRSGRSRSSSYKGVYQIDEEVYDNMSNSLLEEYKLCANFDGTDKEGNTGYFPAFTNRYFNVPDISSATSKTLAQRQAENLELTDYASNANFIHANAMDMFYSRGFYGPQSYDSTNLWTGHDNTFTNWDIDLWLFNTSMLPGYLTDDDTHPIEYARSNNSVGAMHGGASYYLPGVASSFSGPSYHGNGSVKNPGNVTTFRAQPERGCWFKAPNGETYNASSNITKMRDPVRSDYPSIQDGYMYFRGTPQRRLAGYSPWPYPRAYPTFGESLFDGFGFNRSLPVITIDFSIGRTKLSDDHTPETIRDMMKELNASSPQTSDVFPQTSATLSSGQIQHLYEKRPHTSFAYAPVFDDPALEGETGYDENVYAGTIGYEDVLLAGPGGRFEFGASRDAPWERDYLLANPNLKHGPTTIEQKFTTTLYS